MTIHGIIASLVVSLVLTGCGQGPQGIPGPQGPPGDPGSQGPQGPKGLDGVNITVVQFCPGSPVYPTVFPETGLCITGRLYAVYSANNGFLTEIIPGMYYSNAIGSRCTFQILENCVVKN